MKIWPLLILLFCNQGFSQQGNYESWGDGTEPLTDEEYQQSQGYIHDGLAEKVYKEQCVKEDGTIDTLCTSADSAFADGSTEQKLEEMMPMVTMAYSAFAGVLPVKYTEKENGGPILTDGKSEFKKGPDGLYRDPNTGQAINKNQAKEMGLEQKSKEGQDYCGMIPQFAVPAITMFEQRADQNTQQNLDQSEPMARQRASFLALAKAHKDRAKSSKIQFGMWGATAGCYGALLLTNTLQPNAGAIVKTGAATLLAYFYNLKRKAHKDRADLLEKMANEYPGAGECDPFTHTSCFCNEETSQASDPTNYMNKCVPKGYAKNYNNKDSFICVNAQGTPDPSCECTATGSCLDSKFNSIGSQIGLNPSMMRDPLAGIKPLTSGFGASKLDQITERNLAYAKKAMDKIKPKDLNKIVLDSKKQKLAKGFNKMGIPKAYAAHMAAASKGGSAPSLATSGFGSSNIGVKGKGINKAFQITAKKPKFLSGKSQRERRTSKSSSPFGRFGRKGGTSASGAEILNFAEQAAREAEITKDSSKPIFDIITYRYKASAWREFRDQINKQLEEDKIKK